MKDVRAILFDLDGCLTDSGPSIIHCLQYTLRELGEAERPVESLRRYIGPPLRDNMVDLLGESRADEGVRLFRYCFQDLGAGVKYTRAYDGIAQALEGLNKAGKDCFIATSKGLDSTMMVLESLSLKPFFKGFYGGGANGIDKGELIAKVMKEQGLDMTCVMVGDRYHDIEGAKKNGIRSIGVGWGYGSEMELRGAKCDVYVRTPGDLLSLFV